MKKQKEIVEKASPKMEESSKSEDNCTVVNLQEKHKQLKRKKFVNFIVNNSKSF